MKQLFPRLHSAIPPSFSVCFLVACSIYFNVYLCAKPVSEWLDTLSICGLRRGGDVEECSPIPMTSVGFVEPKKPSQEHLILGFPPSTTISLHNWHGPLGTLEGFRCVFLKSATAKHEANVPRPKKINYVGSNFQQLWSIKLHIWRIHSGINPLEPARSIAVAPPGGSALPAFQRRVGHWSRGWNANWNVCHN